MTVSFGETKERFTWSVFLVLCNRLMTSTLAAGVLAVSTSHSRSSKACMGKKLHMPTTTNLPALLPFLVPHKVSDQAIYSSKLVVTRVKP